MANLSGALANFGLMSRGAEEANKAAQDREFEAQRIEAQRRANAAADQQAELTGQRIRTGSIAEAELGRQAASAEAYRKSTQGLGLDASEADLHRATRTTALGLGDAGVATKSGEALSAGEDQAKLWLAKNAVSGIPSDEVLAKVQKGGYLDLAELKFVKVPSTVGPNDPPGAKPGDTLIMGRTKNGNARVFNASEIIRRSAPSKISPIGAAGSIAQDASGRVTTIAPLAPAQKDQVVPKGATLRYIDADGATKFYTAPDRDNTAKISTNPLNGQTIMIIGEDAFEHIPGTPGSPGEKNWFFPDKPEIPGTPPSWRKMSKGESGGGQQSSAATGPKHPNYPDAILDVVDGKQMWVRPDPDRPGKFIGLPVQGQAAPTPAQTPKPAPKATPKARSPGDAGVIPASDTEAIPELVGDNSSKQEIKRAGNAARRAERAASIVEGAKSAAEGLKSVGRAMSPDESTRSVSGFRELLKQGKYTRASAPMIEAAIKSGDLTPSEYAKAQKMLGRLRQQTAKFNRGGRVSKYQGYGLGA